MDTLTRVTSDENIVCPTCYEEKPLEEFVYPMWKHGRRICCRCNDNETKALIKNTQDIILHLYYYILFE